MAEMAEKKDNNSPEFQVTHDLYKSPQGSAIGDRMVRDEDFYNDPTGDTVAMYPKGQVYPPTGGEFSLEEIRANFSQYKYNQDDCSACMMEFTCMPVLLPPVYQSTDVQKTDTDPTPQVAKPTETLQSLFMKKRNSSVSVPAKQLTTSVNIESLTLSDMVPEQQVVSKREEELYSSTDSVGSEENTAPFGYNHTPPSGAFYNRVDKVLTFDDDDQSYSDHILQDSSLPVDSFQAYEDSVVQERSAALPRSPDRLPARNASARPYYTSNTDCTVADSFTAYEDSHISTPVPVSRPVEMAPKNASARPYYTSNMDCTVADSFSAYEDSHIISTPVPVSRPVEMAYEDSVVQERSAALPRSPDRLPARNASARPYYTSNTDCTVADSFSAYEDSHISTPVPVSRPVEMQSQDLEHARRANQENPAVLQQLQVRKPLALLKGPKPKYVPSQSSVCDSFSAYGDSTADDLYQEGESLDESEQYTDPSYIDHTGLVQRESVFEQSVTIIGIPHTRNQQFVKLSSTPSTRETTATLLPGFDVTAVGQSASMLDCPTSATANPPSYVNWHQPLAARCQPTSQPSPPAHAASRRGKASDRSTELKSNLAIKHVTAVNIAGLNIVSEEHLQSTNATSSAYTATGSELADHSGGRNFLTAAGSNLPFSAKPPVVNPFKPDVVASMLKSLQAPSIHVESNPPKTPILGSHITVGGMKYHVQKQIGQGAFATVFQAHDAAGQSVALKVQSPADYWEYALVKELRFRLRAEGKGRLQEMFVDFLNAAVLGDTSVLVLPLHELGTMLDLINRHPVLPEMVIAMLISGTLKAMGVLHRMDIIHADIKPDNLLLRKSRLGKLSVVLCDFSRSIDLRAFPKGIVFLGSSYTSAFECLQMKKNQPWKWQVDTFALAVSIHIIAFRNYNFDVEFCEETAKYKNSRKMPRHWHQSEWQELVSELINTTCEVCPNFQKWVAILSGYAAGFSEQSILELL